MFNRDEFESVKRKNAEAQSRDRALQSRARKLLEKSDNYDYVYQWAWLGLPIIQLPADILVTQEIIWDNKPDVVIETGIAWGGSVVFYASVLELIGKRNSRVIGVDLNLMDHVTAQIMKYPFSNRIQLYKGSSTDPAVAAKVKSHIRPDQSVMVLLDSNHTHDHVLAELRTYAPLVTKGQFLVVTDTFVEDVPQPKHRPRPWGPGNNPKTAMQAYLREVDRFESDSYINSKLLTTLCPGGYLRCLK